MEGGRGWGRGGEGMVWGRGGVGRGRGEGDFKTPGESRDTGILVDNKSSVII